MSEANWEEEREKLLECLRKAEQIAVESQAEAAVYRDLLEDWHEAARQALTYQDPSRLLMLARTSSSYMPEDIEKWGRYFLDASRIDAGWLEDTKKALKQIKAVAEKSLEENTINAEVEKVLKRIITVADEGLVEHV